MTTATNTKWQEYLDKAQAALEKETPDTAAASTWVLMAHAYRQCTVELSLIAG